MQTIASQKIDVAKVVATPTLTSWSQAYNAGKLYAVIALSSDETQTPLSALGKECITILESEFFSLEEKNLTTLEQVAKAVYEKMPETITVSLVLVAMVESILYIVTTKNGNVFIKRGDTYGIVTKAQNQTNFTTFSGYLQNGDGIVLATQAFFDTVSSSGLAKVLENQDVEKVQDALLPLIEEKGDSSAAALILFYHEEASTFDQAPVVAPVETQQPQPEQQEESSFDISSQPTRKFSMPKLPRIPFPFKGKKKLLFLIVAAILILVFTAAVIKNVRD